MRRFFLKSSLVALLLSSNTLFAGEACLLESNGLFMGIKMDVKDCAQNAGIPAKHFKSQCESMAQFPVSIGAPAAKITYLSSCPVPFQAKCDTAQIKFFYYKRSSDEFAGIKSGCEMMQGTYTQGSLK